MAGGRRLIGLLLNDMFGWMWADSIAALVIAGLAIGEGVETWRGDVESPFEVLEDLDDEHAADEPGGR
jgi:divalent metal cation (Fe/Co/Zn/Cd) transporter